MSKRFGHENPTELTVVSTLFTLSVGWVGSSEGREKSRPCFGEPIELLASSGGIAVSSVDDDIVQASRTQIESPLSVYCLSLLRDVAK